MFKASNPGLFILLNYFLLGLVFMSIALSLCAVVNTEQACSTMAYLVTVVNCFLLMYVWYRLFTWKC